MEKYLQLRVLNLQCVTMTQNRQNFLGIPLETDPDAIDISTIAVDAEHGVVVNSPTVFLGNRYTSGKVETFGAPKVISEFPISDADVYPRRIEVSVNMAEKDDGGGFDSLMGELSQKLSDEIRWQVSGTSSTSSSDDMLWKAVASALQQIGRELGKALGLGDDPFTPVKLTQELRSFADTLPTEKRTIEFREPNPVHQGKFLLTYDWYFSTQRALTNSPSIGSSTAALTAKGGTAPAADPYPRPFRVHRFRPSRHQKPVVISPIPLHMFPSWMNLLGASVGS